MPDKCCVPGCRGNYTAASDQAAEKVSVFRFPDDPEMRSKWLHHIPRKDFTVGKRSVVCEKHFSSDFIIREDVVKRPDGSILCVPREKPKLTNDAYPTMFPNTPSYLSSVPPQKRKNPESRRLELCAREERQFVEWMEDDKIRNFADLATQLPTYIKDYLDKNWIIMQPDRFVFVALTDLTDIPHFKTVIRVDSALQVDIFNGEILKDSASLHWVLGKECKLSNWSQLSALMSYLNSSSAAVITITKKIVMVEKTLKELAELVNDDDDNFDTDICSRLQMSEQILLLFSVQKRYRASTVLMAFRLFAISASVYNRIRNTFLTLPHMSYLKRLSAVISVHGGLADANYLQQKCQVLQQHERHVILMLDEIYVEAKTNYKAGTLTGWAANSATDDATTVQAFMLSSILSKNKDIVALVPVKNLDAKYLVHLISSVLKLLDACGYHVVCVISDNNRINRNAFTVFCGGTLQPEIDHPFNPGKKLFLFDSVHLLKCIRNNWLGEIDLSIVFPHPETSEVLKANFNHIRQLYDSEKHSIVKMAPGLCYKAIYPTNTDRQNVQLALKIFNEKTIAALSEFGLLNNIDIFGTKKFLSQILRFWNIVNVKSSGKDLRKRDNAMAPINSIDCENLHFLSEFHSWLQTWEGLKLQARHGCLSKETMFALKHTINTFIHLSKYLLDNMGFSFVLLGKFQTDCLEFRFSQYRQMSGATYRVSVQEIFESEKKLKIVSLLHVISHSNGKIPMTDFLSCQGQENEKYLSIDSFGHSSDFSCTVTGSSDNIDLFMSALSQTEAVTVTDAEAQALVFIAGYVAHKLIHTKISCKLCYGELITDKEMELEFHMEANDYLVELDRLKWPSEFLVEIVTQCFLLFSVLISSQYERQFLCSSNHKKLFIALALEQLKIKLSRIMLIECTCGSVKQTLAENCLSYIANIFLNNYSKKRRDMVASAGKSNQKQLQKLSTFSK